VEVSVFVLLIIYYFQDTQAVASRQNIPPLQWGLQSCRKWISPHDNRPA